MRVATLKASLKVFTISQLGDFIFIVGVASMCAYAECSDILTINVAAVSAFGSFDLVSNSLPVSLPQIWAISIVAALLLKAAQLVFYPWLLDAMEAPVPISAQLHSSTLVIIGFYAFLRFSPIVLLCDGVLFTLASSGILTAVGASVCGFYQTDGKRLLACSTAGQLGYVLVALGSGLLDEALSLLAFCCCNKALTFVSLGSAMERLGGLSDFRAMSGTRLLVVERACIAVSVSNSTILPGAFIWHTKSLLSRGSLDAQAFACVSIDFLSITWALTSMYLFRLCLSMFASVSRGSSSPAQAAPKFRPVGLAPTARLSSILLATMLVLTSSAVELARGLGLNVTSVDVHLPSFAIE